MIIISISEYEKEITDDLVNKYGVDKMEKYTGRQIAIFTDIHGLLYPTIAILQDIKRRGIKEIYSLGDNIGVGPNPSEVLDLLGEYLSKIVEDITYYEK